MSAGRILLIDDEADMRLSTAQALDLEGFQVEDVADAQSALDRVGFGFAGVVITDIRMPGMDGMTLMRRIRDIDADIPTTNGDGWVAKIRQKHATLQAECIADMSEMKSLRWREEVHSIKKHRSAAEESTASGTSIDQRRKKAKPSAWPIYFRAERARGE